jgi:DNA-binding NtrC family response regulator
MSFETVLVCDDDDGVRRLLAEVLGLRAYTILQASNGKQASGGGGAPRGPIHLLVTGSGDAELADRARG